MDKSEYLISLKITNNNKIFYFIDEWDGTFYFEKFFEFAVIFKVNTFKPFPR